MSLFKSVLKPKTGAERAAAREVEQRKRNDQRLSAKAMEDNPSRQQAQVEHRAFRKRELSIAKRDAMKLKWPGGAAAVR